MFFTAPVSNSVFLFGRGQIVDEYKIIQQKYGTGEQFVSAAIVAKHLNLNLWTVYKLAERNKIRSHKFGKSLRFKISELEES